MFNRINLVATSAASKMPSLLKLSLLKLSTGITLSVALLALAPSVQAAASSHVGVSEYKGASCNDVNNTKAKTANPKHQSSKPQSIDCMLTQLRDYQLSQNIRQQYFAYKAQAWLNYANHQDNTKIRSPASKYALQSGATILQALKNGTDKNLSLTPDIPTMSALMRPDLWAILSALKDNGGINNAPRELAFSEVALIWAAADHCNDGSSQDAGAQFRMADRWLEQAREAYITAHDSETNVALEGQTVSYYKQFAPLDPNDDICRGQVLPLNTKVDNKINNKTSNTRTDSSLSETQTITISMPIPTATYQIAH